MNVLHVVPAYYPATYWGGPIFSVYALNNALARLPEVRLKILTTDTCGPLLSDRLDSARLNPALFPNQEVLFTRRIAGNEVSLELLRKLPFLIRWADVVHLTGTYSFPTIPTLLLCRLSRKPVVWSHRGAILDAREWADAPRKRLKRLWEIVCNALISRANVVAHVTSEKERDAAEARIPKASAVVIPNGVDALESLPDREWLPQGRLRLMYLGRISPKKGLENLVHALDGLNDKTISLTVYGDGPAEYVANVKQLAASLSLSTDAISFAGRVEGEAKEQAFNSSDLCVVPSFSENFCLVIAEALAHGLPVVASRGTPWSRIEDKQCGLWVDNDPRSLALAIETMRKMQLREMGHRGWKWMKSEFGWRTQADVMCQLYRDLSEGIR